MMLLQLSQPRMVLVGGIPALLNLDAAVEVVVESDRRLLEVLRRKRVSTKDKSKTCCPPSTKTFPVWGNRRGYKRWSCAERERCTRYVQMSFLQISPSFPGDRCSVYHCSCQARRKRPCGVRLATVAADHAVGAT